MPTSSRIAACWPVVAASIVATSISGVTFIGLPVWSSPKADLRYLQFALAALIAKGVLGGGTLPRYYAAGVGSPYEYITLKLGPGATAARPRGFS